MTDAGQIPFQFEFRPALGAEDFLVAHCNAEAVAWIDRWPDWPVPVLAVYGPLGCGKTHLARVFAGVAGARILTADGIRDRDPDALLGDAPACVIEDAEAVIGTEAEEALFHLYNAVVASGRHMMITAHEAPSRWAVELPDLQSRLKAAAAVEIGQPDEALTGAVMIKLFADHQLHVGDDVVAYVLPRIERTFQAAIAIVDALDRRALVRQHKITIPLARQVLAELNRDGNKIEQEEEI